MMSEKQQSLLAMASTFPFSFYNPVLQLKAVAEGNSRLFSLHHHHQHHSPPPGLSPPGTQSMLCSPPVSTSREQAARLHHHLQQEHHKSLKFSIDNILSPSFGATAPRITAADDRISVTKRDKREKHATSKRKYSSDSESSNSSNSTHSLQKSPKKEQASATSAITTSTTSSTSSQSSSSSSAKSSSKSKGSDDNDSVHAPEQGPNPSLPFPLDGKEPIVWPAWVYCTRYSDRPSSGKSNAPHSFSSTLFSCVAACVCVVSQCESGVRSDDSGMIHNEDLAAKFFVYCFVTKNLAFLSRDSFSIHSPFK